MACAVHVMHELTGLRLVLVISPILNAFSAVKRSFLVIATLSRRAPGLVPKFWQAHFDNGVAPGQWLESVNQSVNCNR